MVLSQYEHFRPSKRLKRQRRYPKFNSKCKCLALSSQYRTTDRQGERVRHRRPLVHRFPDVEWEWSHRPGCDAFSCTVDRTLDRLFFFLSFRYTYEMGHFPSIHHRGTVCLQMFDARPYGRVKRLKISDIEISHQPSRIFPSLSDFSRLLTIFINSPVGPG